MEQNNGNDNPEMSDADLEALQTAPEGETAEAKAERLESLNKQLFARTKKAEGFELRDGQWVKKPKAAEPAKPAAAAAPPVEPSQQQDLSTADVLFLSKADIHEDDLQEVIDYAKLKKIPVKEATAFFKPILQERTEQRRTAAAANAGNGTPRGGAVNGDTLVDRFKSGAEIPMDKIDDLAAASWERKRNRNKK